ncbi:MAG: hypothetical protein R3D67_07680 [Hyphomicrobiaceae bacterium]
MSAASSWIDDVAVLLALLVSFVAPAVPVTVVVPTMVVVPDTEQVIVLPAGSNPTGGVGVQPVTDRPAGSPETAQVALMAAAEVRQQRYR